MSNTTTSGRRLVTGWAAGAAAGAVRTTLCPPSEGDWRARGGAEQIADGGLAADHEYEGHVRHAPRIAGPVGSLLGIGWETLCAVSRG